MSQQLFELFEQVANTSKRNEKISLLEATKGTPLEPMVKHVLWMTYDPSIDFYIKEFETDVDNQNYLLFGDAISDLENIIAKRVFTGNMAKHHIEETYAGLSTESADIYARVIQRDMRMGAGASTINKVWDDLIYVHPYMRCSSFSEKNLANISLPAYSQTKMDGLYCDIIIREDSVVYRSRNGQILEFNTPERDAALIPQVGWVLQGEMLAVDETGALMERSKSNGYLNSNDIDPMRLRFFIWDMITVEDFDAKKSKTPYETRFQRVMGSDVLNIDFISLVETRVVESKDEIIDHFREVRIAGEEGLILKDFNGLWKNGTSKHQIKVKVVFDCDLKLVGWKEGTGKYAGMLGSLQFETSDGGIKVSVGTGYSDDQRKEWWDEEILQSWVDQEKIGVIRANDTTLTEDGRSLFLPRFVEFRTDKDEADSTQRIDEQIKAFVDALALLEQ